jgi:hypothetical protein
MDMRSVLTNIAESLRGTFSLDVESLTDQFTVLSEDHVRPRGQTVGLTPLSYTAGRIKEERHEQDLRNPMEIQS